MAMNKEVRQSIIELWVVEGMTIWAMVKKLLDEHNEKISFETIRKDVLQIKGVLDLEKPGWDEWSEEDLLRETVRRGFDPKDKTVSVKDGLAARKALDVVMEEAGAVLELPEHHREYPLSPAVIALSHMSNENLIEKLESAILTIRKLPE